MRILFASDHAGFELKERLRDFVVSLGYTVEDVGALTYDETDDYPQCIVQAAKQVSEDPLNTRAIILGGSGQGEAIVANRFPQVRAAVFYGNPQHTKDESIVTLSRVHNDANVLSLGARFLEFEEAKDAVLAWLRAEFRNEDRHVRRIASIESVSKK
jgi:ribose 5-phosphate isomerase B